MSPSAKSSGPAISAILWPRFSAYWNCWPIFFASGKTSAPMPRGAQAACHALIFAEAVGRELHDEHRGRRRVPLQQFQFFERGEQPIQAERAPTPGSDCFGIEPGEIIVTAAGADAAEIGQIGQERFVDRAGVVIEPAADRQVDPMRPSPAIPASPCTSSSCREQRMPSAACGLRHWSIAEGGELWAL